MTLLTKGTVFRVDPSILINCVIVWVLWAVLAAIWISKASSVGGELRPEELAEIENASKYLNTFCPFVLALFLSVSLWNAIWAGPVAPQSHVRQGLTTTAFSPQNLDCARVRDHFSSHGKSTTRVVLGLWSDPGACMHT